MGMQIESWHQGRFNKPKAKMHARLGHFWPQALLLPFVARCISKQPYHVR